MADDVSSRRRRRGTGVRGKLRRFNNVEHVIVEEPFGLSVPPDTPSAIRTESGIRDPGGSHAGDGYYVSATVHNRRYYGLLVDQSALKAASLLHFHDEARSLDLNRRMKILQQSRPDQEGKEATDSDQKKEASSAKRPLNHPPDRDASKRAKTNQSGPKQPAKIPDTAVQKFRYVDQPGASESDPGYRILLATYANVSAAAEDDSDKCKAIATACEKGGDYVGDYYYQFQIASNSLKSSSLEKPSDVGLRTSLGFDYFLHKTPMPSWFPLSNLQISQHKVLSMLQMKRNNKGGVSWNAKAAAESEQAQGTQLPMEARTRFRIGVVGGGIAGLSCAKELLEQAERDKIEIEVVVLEGRSRLGGRLLTDATTFKCSDGSPFPVDLGASWIHGIDHNPLAALAKEAGTDFVTSSEEVKMLGENLAGIDKDVDEKMGQLFDKLLDKAADDVWEADDYTPTDVRDQSVIRWYGSGLRREASGVSDADCTPPTSDAAPHRHSSDVSIDHAVGLAVSKYNSSTFKAFGAEENALLLWNTRNIEYALGANIRDLSMKFWDSDERHAFEGDHVMLQQGYSAVVHHLEKDLVRRGDKFRCILDFPVGKIEYARKSTTMPYADTSGLPSKKMVELSDTCCVTSRDKEMMHKFDFVVSTLPLGVLKGSVQEKDDSRVEFQPPLPFPKVDAIKNTGFGLLNKVYLQFPRAFWRLRTVFDDGQNIFGNATGYNTHHYMFFDVGQGLARKGQKPPVLMTLISGIEAVNSELLGDEELVRQVCDTLRKIFSDSRVPDPISWKVTRWGSDPFSRGCYTFLPPGATDQDFQILQSPINGNGDSLTLEGSETMRLFWAGEHTTSLHPSMAHGAMLSGIRAAKEVISTINLNFNTGSGFDKLIPLSIFRKRNPTAKLQCSLCHLVGSRVREGSLLAFQKGSRQVLVHNNCGESSPEVEVRDGQWKSIIKAVNRGKQINCCMCGRVGATIGCTHDNCFRSFHYSCAVDTGWRFERDGKVYFCDLHRDFENHRPNECDRISLLFYRTKQPPAAPALRCTFCKQGDDKSAGCGEMLAFQQRNTRLLVHDKCARYTNIMETTDDPGNAHEIDFQNLFEVLQQAKACVTCGAGGATIQCHSPSCTRHYHYRCALHTGWDFSDTTTSATNGRASFLCPSHREDGNKKPQAKPSHALFAAGAVQHNLFGPPPSASARASGGARASNEAGSASRQPLLLAGAGGGLLARALELNDGDGDDDDSMPRLMEFPLCDSAAGVAAGQSRPTMRSLSRTSLLSSWNFSMRLTAGGRSNQNALQFLEGGVDGASSSPALLIKSVNGNQIGAAKLRCLRDVLSAIKTTTVLQLQLEELQECPGKII